MSSRPAPEPPPAAALAAERWRQLKDLVADALDLPPAERGPFVVRHTATAPELRDQASALLEAAVAAADFLDAPAGPGVLPVALQPLAPGERCERYTIEALIGEGGFSEVYRASQSEPIVRTVALKVLKPGMDSRAVLARFALERRTLARLDHPGIARILDAGATARGRPFVVVDLVDGPTLLRHVERTRPALPARLRLFLQVCDAVAHAHQRGVIHRDLKPGNVLVVGAGDDARAIVIDFGIAKVLDGERFAMTVAGQFLGTPDYCSPEQRAGDVDDVDTRTDVFALGVVLAELVTERRFADDAAAALPLELRWIVAMATADDRERRYAGVAELADDVRAFLARERLRAGPPTWRYRLRTLARRHRLALAASGAALVAAAAIAVALAVGYVREERGRRAAESAQREERAARVEAESARAEEARARGLAEAAQRDAESARRAAEAAREEATATADYLARLLAAADPARRGRDVKVVDLLDASDGLLRQANARPDVAARLHYVVGDAYTALGEFAKAEPHLRRAADEYAARHGEHDWRGIAAAFDLAALLHRAGRLDEAAVATEAVAARAVAARGEDHPLRRRVVDVRAKLAFDRGTPAAAEGPLRELLALDEAAGRMDAVIATHGNLAQVLLGLRRIDEARALATRGLALARERHGFDHPLALAAARKLAAVHIAAGDATAVVRELEPVLAAARARLGADHPDTLGIANYHANALVALGRRDEAEPIYRELIAAQARKLDARHPQAMMTLHDFGMLLLQKGDAAAAEPFLRDAATRFAATRGEADGEANKARLHLAQAIAAQGRHREAAAGYAAAVAAVQKARPGDTTGNTRLLDGWLEHLQALAGECEAAADRAGAAAAWTQVATVAAQRGRDELALRARAAAERLRE